MSHIITSAANRAHLALTLVFAALSLSLYAEVQSWILLLAGCAVTMRLALFYKWYKHIPSVRTINLLSVLSALVLAVLGYSLGLLMAMFNLLVMASALKLMLLRRHKDYFQLIIACFFLAACGFIFQQGIAISLFYFACVLGLLLSLAWQVNPSLSLTKQACLVGKYSLQALPIGILLFLVMPQLGPLWQLPTGKDTQTGLSEKITPGDIANLSQSSELAFRAAFTGTVPAREQLYWRALVLEDFDGHSWQVHPARKKLRERVWRAGGEFKPQVSGEPLRYQVIAQASGQPWLFALDLATSEHDLVWQDHSYQLLAKRPLQSRLSYQVTSYPNLPLNQGYSSLDQRLSLGVPERGNPQTRAWVDGLLQQHGRSQSFVNAVLRYFAEDFRYTLNPPLMPTEPVDALLFEHKAGFCSHFAGAFAFAMRLANIPARVVTGYAGGELADADYLSVYQYDAHAWTEIWLDERGWQRIDPTAVVAPERISLGLEAAVAYEDSFLAEAPFSLAKFKNIAWLNQLRMLLADADFLWSQWVLGFDREQQRDLFEQLLGQITSERMMWLSLTVVMTIFALLLGFNLRQWLPKRQPAHQRLYQKSLKRLHKRGLKRSQWQGPMDFAEQVRANLDSHSARAFVQLTRDFVALEYASQAAQPEILNRMRQQLRQISARAALP